MLQTGRDKHLLIRLDDDSASHRITRASNYAQYNYAVNDLRTKSDFVDGSTS